MKKIFFLFVIFFFQNIFSDQIPYFYCPSSWKIVNPKHYSNLIKISFIKNEKSLIRPSINLAVEKTSLSLDEYVNLSKKNQMSDSQTDFLILDKVNLKQGKAYICKIDKNSNSIDLDLMQLIFIKDEMAYVLTGASKKNEMINNYKTFMKSFLSFEVIDDIFSVIKDNNKKVELISIINKLKAESNSLKKKEKQKKLISFEKYLDKKFQNEGKYFQVLLFQKINKEYKGI